MDWWIKTDDSESLIMSRRLIREEGLLCGEWWAKSGHTPGLMRVRQYDALPLPFSLERTLTHSSVPPFAVAPPPPSPQAAPPALPW